MIFWTVECSRKSGHSKKLIHTLRPLQDVTIRIAGRQIVAEPRIDPDTAGILNKIPDLTGH